MKSLTRAFWSSLSSPHTNEMFQRGRPPRAEGSHSFGCPVQVLFYHQDATLNFVFLDCALHWSLCICCNLMIKLLCTHACYYLFYIYTLWTMSYELELWLTFYKWAVQMILYTRYCVIISLWLKHNVSGREGSHANLKGLTSWHSMIK